jgi:WD40 repeat-containing protein SMU1
VQQFLQENQLHQSLQALQDESLVKLSALSPSRKELLLCQIAQGQVQNWDFILQQVSVLKLPPKSLVSLYILLLKDLVFELQELSLAQSLLSNAEPLLLLKDLDPPAFYHLQSLVSESPSPPQEKPTLKEREKVAQELNSAIHSVEPCRLLSLIGQSVKWQLSQGLISSHEHFDLFRGVSLAEKALEDLRPTTCFQTIKVLQ